MSEGLRGLIIQKELFIPSGVGYSSAYSSSNNFGGTRFQNSSDQDMFLNFKVPIDFLASLPANLYMAWFASPAAGNIRWYMQVSYAASGEIVSTHNEGGAWGETATGGVNIINVQESPTAIPFTNLALGDYVGVRTRRDAPHANDNLGADVFVIGLLFTYWGLSPIQAAV